MKKEIIYVIAIVIGLLVCVLLPEYLWIGIIITLGATLLYGISYFNEKKQASKPKVKPEDQPLKDNGEDVNWDSEVSSPAAYQYLLHSNFKLRVDSVRSDENDVREIESLIDELRGLVLVMENSSSVLKWKINQICVDFMPKLVNKYNLATDASRSEIMKTTVAETRAKLTEIETAINTNNQQEFEHYANTLQSIMKA